MTIHTVNHNFFDIWSQDMAYCLGFLTADGCIINLKGNRQDRISFHIHKQDIDVLRFIRKNLDPKRKIVYETNTPHIQLRISCDILSKSLSKLQVTPNKTGKEQFPKNIPPKYVSDYIRGYFDGDGSIYYSKRNDAYYICIYCASKSFLTQIQNIINTGYIYKNRSIFKLCISKKKEVCQFYQFLYNDGFGMKRKRAKFKKMANHHKYKTILNHM